MRTVHSLLVLSVLALPVPHLAVAQVTNVTGDVTPPVPGAHHDYIHLLNETVNPGSGSVSIRITPPVPDSRGFTVPFSFAYDSNAAVHAGGPWTDNLSYLGQAGWSYTVPMLTYQVNAIQGPPPPSGGGPPPVCLYYLDYILTDIGGGSHALGISSIQPAGVGLCDGRTSSMTFTPGQPIRNVLGGADAKIQAVTSAPTSQNAPPVTIADMNGTTYIFPGNRTATLDVPPGNSSGSPAGSNGNVAWELPMAIEDRNGNTVNISDHGNGAFTITDTTGRAALSSSGFGASGNTVTISGLSNPYTLTWATPAATTLTYSYAIISSGYPSNCNGGIGGSSTQTGTQSIPYNSRNVITQISLPNGTAYQFQYDPATSLLSKLVYPSGGYL